MKSGGGVLYIASMQLVVGICLLGIYEGYKSKFLHDKMDATESMYNSANKTSTSAAVAPFPDAGWLFRTPMDFVFYISIVSNVFSVLGLAGVLNQQRELVTGFFTYNAVQMVVSFHYFVDVCADVGIRFAGESRALSGYEKAAAAFMFFNFFLSVCATLFAVKAIEEIRTKQREDYNRLAVLSDTLQFEPDHA